MPSSFKSMVRFNKAESCSFVTVVLITQHLLCCVYFSTSGIWTLIKHLASILSQMQKYFLEMKNKMPSLSPIDKNWPARPYLFLDSTHKELKRIFHLWRVGHILVQSIQKVITWFSVDCFLPEEPIFRKHFFPFQTGWLYFFGRSLPLACKGYNYPVYFFLGLETGLLPAISF